MTSHARAEGTIRPATIATLELIRSFNREKRCNFLISSNYMHAETAKLGYFLATRLARETSSAGASRTFFVNAGLEALSGAIKLARQSSVREGRQDGGWILILDEHERYRPFLDPTNGGIEQGLTPHLRFTRSVEDALTHVDAHAWSAIVHVRYPSEKPHTAVELVASARRRGAMVVVVDNEMELGSDDLTSRGYAADVVVFGDNLTEHQVPFGCFTMTEKAHSVWDNDVDCFAQTSTFGGNRLCAAAAVAALERRGYITEQHREVFREIDASPERMREYWGKHVNPGMARLASIFGMDMEVREAFGARLHLADGRELLDCSGGFGSNLRGHNPPDIDALVSTHQPDHDYFAELEQLLCGLTKFDQAFPAVSGATAVDVAASIAMLANPSRRKVVTFNGNFSGKTLFALNFSKLGPQLTESDTDAFRPYYADLVYIDPFAPDAEAELKRVLTAGDVALVWFEIFRGGMCEELPAKVVQLVDELKGSGGYLIGVDEVLSGGWRSGKNYLAHADLMKNSDLVSLGKTLSDMTLPMAAVLVTNDVFERAREANPEHVARLRNHYRNNLAANVACHAIRQSSAQARRSESLKNQQLVEAELRQLAAESPLFSGVRGRGTLLVLIMNQKYFPFHHRSKPGNLLEMSLAHLILERCGVFVFLLRFLHRVDSDEADVRELLARLRAGLAGISPWMVYRYALSRILSQKAPRLAAVVAGKLRSSSERPLQVPPLEPALRESELHRAQ